MPARWQGNPTVIGAVAALAAMASGCQKQEARSKPLKETASLIAPVFKHGDGIGSYGCVAINPPVFLSEDEARSVIYEEAKKAGIHFKPDHRTIYDNKKQISIDRVKIELEGIDRERGIGFVYVDEKSNDLKSETFGTAFEYKTYESAVTVVNELNKAKPKMVVGTFYEPLGSYDWNKMANDVQHGKSMAIGETAAENANKAALRAQVRDFIKWLKQQGVI